MSTRCPTCGSTYAADARFCPKDGSKLESRPAPAPSDDASGPHARIFESLRHEGRATTQRGGASSAPLGPPKQVDFSKLVGQTLDGRYKILKKIGEGGMSFVYLATDARGDKVAIKILSPSLSQDRNAMARLRREAELGGKLAHPNVCHIVRLGETAAGMVYVVMPFVDGELLCDRTIREKHLPLDLTVRFVQDMAAGLHLAHQLGIIHRDLKPENIMISPLPDGTERAVVMDFGLAKERRVGPEVQKLTATGIVLGTPEFMSPEQLRGKPLDARTDVYSLGLMTYEMLTGKLPFQGRTQQEIMIARLRSEPVPIRTMRPDLGFTAAVEKVLLKSMQRDPDHRYGTAPEYATALATAAAGGTPQSGTSGMLDRLFGR